MLHFLLSRLNLVGQCQFHDLKLSAPSFKIRSTDPLQMHDHDPALEEWIDKLASLVDGEFMCEKGSRRKKMGTKTPAVRSSVSWDVKLHSSHFQCHVSSHSVCFNVQLTWAIHCVHNVSAFDQLSFQWEMWKFAVRWQVSCECTVGTQQWQATESEEHQLF